MTAGTIIPDITLDAVGGGTESLRSSAGAKLIVIYRGQFCPFCANTLAHVQSKLSELKASGLEVVGVSADPLEVATTFAAAKGLEFKILTGLTEEHMRSLGLYVSDPTDYIEQSHRFSEPGYILLNADNTIKYIDISSYPAGGRVNVDTLLAAYNWAKAEGEKRPAFKSVVWGSK